MEGFFYAIKFVYIRYYSYICYMGETAEERLRRLALERDLACINLFDNYVINGNGWNPRGGHPSVLDDTNDYERMLDDTISDMFDEVLDEIADKVSEDVSLVKKYSKGTFKFVNEMKKVEREEYDLIINFFQ